MAYTINGKVYTDHPLMDEICYNCKLILKDIVIKNDVLAANKETAYSLDMAEYYYIIHDSSDGKMTFAQYPFDSGVLSAFGYSATEIKTYLADRNRIPEEDRDELVEFANDYFYQNYFYHTNQTEEEPEGHYQEGDLYKEQNNYYRMLIGLPPYDSGDEYYIYITEDDIPSGYTKTVDYSLPLHEQPDDLLTSMYAAGSIDNLRKNTYIGSNYSYMLFLSERRRDLYTVRKAAKWDILYMPSSYYMIENKFIELYTINRQMYANRSYQQFFADSGEYYDQMMIVIVLSQTFADLVTDVPEWYIRRDIFDLRSVQYFLDSYGVTYFKEIPLRYQIRIVKNLNRLIKYKSSNLNAEDILDIFGADAKISKYWLFKNYDKTKGEYDLEFIASDIEDSYDDYIKNNKNRTPYDDITLQDAFWDSDDTHKYIKGTILNTDFTIQGTKYMSVEYHISLSEYQFQEEYFVGMILDPNVKIDEIKIAIPSIDDNSSFKLSNLFLFLVVLTDIYNKRDKDNTHTILPTVSQGANPSWPDTYEGEATYYNWKKKYIPQTYVPKKGRIYGFNANVDIDALRKVLSERHSHFRFGMPDTEDGTPHVGEDYQALADSWMEEMGIDDYIKVSSENITTIARLVQIYDNNKKCYNTLVDLINNAENEDDKKTYEYVFQELYTKDFDLSMYTLSDGTKTNDLLDVLADRDFVLYYTAYTVLQETNLEARMDLARSIMNDVIDTLAYYLNYDQLSYIFAFTGTESFEAMVKYISLMINFFKSFKVYFLDPYVTYEFDLGSERESSAKPHDSINEVREDFHKFDKHMPDDSIALTDKSLFKDDGFRRGEIFETMDIYLHDDFDPLNDYNYDGLNAEDGEGTEYTDVDGGIAEDTANLPYMTVNGGNAYLGKTDFSDVNGGEANEYGREYYEIDGGTAYDPGVLKTDSMGSAGFEYEIDGGASGSRLSISNTVKTTLVGTELSMDTLLSDQETYIQITDDGLYLPNSAFISLKQYNNLVYSKQTLEELIETDITALREDIKVLSDEDALKARIKKVGDKLLYPMDYVNEQMADDTFKKRVKASTDELVANLAQEFADANSFAWRDL